MKNKFTCFFIKPPAYLPGLLLGVALLLTSALSLRAQTVYVTQDGAGQQTGADWANALPGSQLQPTLASARSGSIFRVAAGLYKPSATGDRMVSFNIPARVALFGGYAGTGPNPDSRVNFAIVGQPSSTTLSGDIDNDNTLDAENANNVVMFYNVGEGGGTQLDGVVITGGYATTRKYTGTTAAGGGGILNYGDFFNDNNGVSSPLIQNCLITFNYAPSRGGGILNDGVNGRTNPFIQNCDFIRNTAGEGGAICNAGELHQSYPVISNCRFLNNNAGNGAAIHNYARGAYSPFSRTIATASPRIFNCIFSGNSASSTGGVMYTYATGIGSTRANPELRNCTLSNNSAPRGGAFYNAGYPGDYGNGAPYQVLSGPYLYNCILWNNGGSAAIFNTPIFAFTPSILGKGIARLFNCLVEQGVSSSEPTDPLVRVITSSPFRSEQSLEPGPCSPAVDAGTNSYYTNGTEVGPTTDIAGNPRIYPSGGIIDIGAYEFQGTPATLLAITQQPASQSSVVAGATVETTVGLNATADSYAWYKDGLIVMGQTSATLRLTNVQLAQAGSYSLVATSACNSVTSTAFSLSVTQPVAQPPVVSATVSQSALCVGSPTGLTAQVSGGTAPYTYSWTTSAGNLDNQLDNTIRFSATTPGSVLINLLVTDANSLTATASVSLLVNAKPVVSINGLASTYSQTDPALTLAGVGTPTGGAFTIDGNTATVLNPASLTLGNHSVSYAFTDASGCSGAASQSVTIVANPSVASLTHFWLINADNNQRIRELTNGQQIDLSTLPSRRIAIQATTEPATVGSVVFQLSGQETRRQVETLAPYALFGDDNKGNYLPWTPTAGNYRLTATPYSESGGIGNAGTALTVSFTVVEPVNPQRLAHLWLINADTDQPIQELTNGLQLDLSKLPTRNLAVQAVTEPTAVGSVVFALSGQQSHQQVETLAPYALFGDNQGHYYSWTPPLGNYKLTATPYSGAGGTGSVGTALSVSFTVIESATPVAGRLAHLWLLNADTDQPIQELTNGQQLDLSKLPTKNLAIQALTEPTAVGSVVFALSGRQSRQQVETLAPYALFGDDQGNFLGWTPALGTYTLTATPYSSVGGTGVAGTPLTVSFTVINPAAARLAVGRVETSIDDNWQVRVLGNPVVGSEVVIDVSGAQGQSLVYTLTDAVGKLIDTRQVAQPNAVERQTLSTGSQGAGLLLLQISTPARRQTVKVLKAN
ncbi:SprB repeat-containing protein [Spirosoma linguale]|uniref:Polymorphic membrane protein n=1 Tax=Spirosoma linguale (strain ATCC 33905 / DSM 74 / LMG 10896 / Claus 1) TaxID=504472 RepID=D2QG76_SPILD|nr:Polymorphic membrane protein [Spirosoma linguale DSM 74]